MLFKSILIAAVVLLSTAVIGDDLPTDYQILKPIVTKDEQKRAISDALNIQDVVSAFVDNDFKVQQLTTEPKSYEDRISEQTFPIERHFSLTSFPAIESSEYMAEALRAFFLATSGSQKLSEGLISDLIEEADKCESGKFAYELAPDIAMNQNEYEIRIRFVAVNCSDKENYELVMYEAFRDGLFKDPSAAHNAIIPQYTRSELLRDMANFFQGKAQTC